MYYFKIPHSALLVEHEDCTIDVFMKMRFSNLKATVKFHAPSKWYATEIKLNTKLRLIEIAHAEFEKLLNKDFCDYKIIDFDNADIELYHGTDAKMIRMTKEERQVHKSYCNHAIEYLYPKFKEKYYNGLFWKVDITSFDTETAEGIEEALNKYCFMSNGSDFFQYPDGILYLTSLFGNAKTYAKDSFAGGELGYIAYFMCKAAAGLFFDLKPDGITANAIEYVLEFGNKKREPVVIPVTGLNLGFLKTENDESIFITNQNYRYSGPLELDLSNATYLD